MPYLIYAIDFENMHDLRESLRAAHRDHLKSEGNKVLASGALLGEEKEVIGGLTLLDTEDRQYALSFAENDPYSKANIRKELQVIYWRKRWWDGQFLLDDL